MKKIKIIIIVLAVLFITRVNVHAASANLSVNKSDVYVGDSFNVSVSLNAAAWNVSVNASGPVTGCSIREADTSSTALNVNKNFTATCTTTGAGMVYVTLSGDMADQSNSDSAIPLSDTKTVNVINRPIVANVPSNNNNNNNNNVSNPPQQTPQTTQEKSKNARLKDLVIDQGKLVKIDDNNYTVELTSNIEEVTIKATPEDNKAKVTGDGKHKINIGENLIEIIITSESGEQNKILIKATRKDSYYIDDLETILQTSQENILSFKIKEDSILTIQQLNALKNSTKTVTLDYYDTNNNLQYSWVIDGSKVSKVEEIATKVEFESKYEEEISKLLKGKDAFYLKIKNEGAFPTGTKLRINVRNKFNDNDKVKIYYYDKDNNKLELITSEKVKSGYVEFNVSKGLNYVITKDEQEKKTTKEKESSYTGPVVFFIISLLVFIISIVVYKKKTKKQEGV